MADNLDNYEGIAALPPFGLFPWFFVIPGIRPAGGAAGDQKRVVTPAGALDSGASILVIGRPITDAPDPTRAIVDIAAGLSHMPA